MERINKYLASAGLGARRKTEELIKSGAVKINGQTAALSSVVIKGDKVTVNNQEIGPKELAYIVLNKPKGHITTTKDPHAALKITDLLPQEYKGLFPVGRLDKDTTGLLVLTNDGDLAFKLTHPRHVKEKEYLVLAKPNPSSEGLGKLRKGVLLEDGLTQPAKIRKKGKVISIIITEGKKRQIRRMFENIGSKVIELKRVRIDQITLGDLPEGKFRKLTLKEVDLLKNE